MAKDIWKPRLVYSATSALVRLSIVVGREGLVHRQHSSSFQKMFSGVKVRTLCRSLKLFHINLDRPCHGCVTDLCKRVKGILRLKQRHSRQFCAFCFGLGPHMGCDGQMMKYFWPYSALYMFMTR